MKKCPFCAEEIQDAAVVCKHCKRELATQKKDTIPCPSCNSRVAKGRRICPACGHDLSGATDAPAVDASLPPTAQRHSRAKRILIGVGIFSGLLLGIPIISLIIFGPSSVNTPPAAPASSLSPTTAPPVAKSSPTTAPPAAKSSPATPPAAAPSNTAQREELIKAQFSLWDGSHTKFTKAIKDSMNDPSSYEHVNTTYHDPPGDRLVITTTFRGKNAFGAVVTKTMMAIVDMSGNVLDMRER